jgi:hypothetical protein
MFAEAVVVFSRGFTFCCAVVRDTTCCCGWAAVLLFFDEFCVLEDRFVFVLTARPVVCCEDTCVDVRFDAARTASALSANVVWDTDKPRHTAKNSIILFIP